MNFGKIHLAQNTSPDEATSGQVTDLVIVPGPQRLEHGDHSPTSHSKQGSSEEITKKVRYMLHSKYVPLYYDNSSDILIFMVKDCVLVVFVCGIMILSGKFCVKTEIYI